MVESNGRAIVVTNHHVIDDGGTVTVIVNDADRHRATVLGYDANKDIAALSICCSDEFQAVPLSSESMPTDGATVFAMGYPLGLSRATVTRGVISGHWCVARVDRCMVQTDAAINPGNSGGPLVNLEGEVIGINTAVVRDIGADISIEGFGFAIAARTVREVLPSLVEGARS